MKNNINKTNLLSVIIAVIIIAVSCNGQNKMQPHYVGKDHGKLDIEKLDFTENIDTLFSKTEHWILPLTVAKSFDKPIQFDTLAFIYRVKNAKHNHNNQFKFGSIQLELDHGDFYVTKSKRFVGVKSAQSYLGKTKEIETAIEQINTKYKQYNVPREALVDGSRVYEWDLPEKIIVILFRKDSELYKDRNEDDFISISIITKKDFEKIPKFLIEEFLYRKM